MKSFIKKLIPSVILLIFGYALTILGTLFKIQHWPYGGEIYTIGCLFEVIAISIAIFVLYRIYKSED